RTAELLHHVHSPNAFSCGGFKTKQRAVRGQRVEAGPIDGGRSTRSVAALLVICAPARCRPDLLASIGIESENELLIALLPLRIEAVADHGERGVTLTEPLCSPY